jgi:hypothetical protein
MKTDDGKPHTIAITDVVVGQRHRHDLGNIEELGASIAEIGLLHPIVPPKGPCFGKSISHWDVWRSCNRNLEHIGASWMLQPNFERGKLSYWRKLSWTCSWSIWRIRHWLNLKFSSWSWINRRSSFARSGYAPCVAGVLRNDIGVSTMIRRHILLVVLIAFPMASGHSAAQEVDSAGRGLALAQQVCARCHAVQKTTNRTSQRGCS